MNISEKHEQKGSDKSAASRNEDRSEYTDIYSKIKKAEVIQEAKCFNSKQIEERKCTDILAKIIYLANHVLSIESFLGRNVHGV